MWFFKRIDKTNEQIDSFFDTVDQALLVFKQGVKNYLYSETDAFNDNLATITKLESDAELTQEELDEMAEMFNEFNATIEAYLNG